MFCFLHTILIYIVLHPYYKLAYIEHAWGGEKEQLEEILDGNIDAKNWQDEAQQIVERTVSLFYIFTYYLSDRFSWQMRRYWAARPRAPVKPTPQIEPASNNTTKGQMSDFDYHRKTLLQREDQEGYQAELRRYLNDIPADVTKDTDIVKYWQVRRALTSLIHWLKHFA